jgi:hypothetical protein
MRRHRSLQRDAGEGGEEQRVEGRARDREGLSPARQGPRPRIHSGTGFSGFAEHANSRNGGRRAPGPRTRSPSLRRLRFGRRSVAASSAMTGSATRVAENQRQRQGQGPRQGQRQHRMRYAHGYRSRPPVAGHGHGHGHGPNRRRARGFHASASAAAARTATGTATAKATATATANSIARESRHPETVPVPVPEPEMPSGWAAPTPPPPLHTPGPRSSRVQCPTGVAPTGAAAKPR